METTSSDFQKHVLRRRNLRDATDDEILGIGAATELPKGADGPDGAGATSAAEKPGEKTAVEPEQEGSQRELSDELNQALAAHPELRRAWEDAGEYRKTFGSPEQAKKAAAELSEVEQLDALFFSKRAEDHAELARVVASLDPESFARFAQAIQSHFRQPAALNAAASSKRAVPTESVQADQAAASEAHGRTSESGDPGFQATADGSGTTQLAGRTPEALGKAQLTAKQAQFLHAANAEAVQNVVEAVEAQLEHLLPEGMSQGARNRVVGDIYRELQSTLQSNRQLSEQLREAFRGGAMDAAHQRAIVSLLTARAKQALPGVAKRVMSEWTGTLVSSRRGGRERQRTAETRVDIAGSNSAGGHGRRPVTPRDIDYSRMSDAEILNL